MANLFRFLSRKVRSPRVGAVREPIDQPDTRALAGVGQAAASVGLAFVRHEKAKQKELDVADANREIAIATGFANKQMVDHDLWVQNNPSLTPEAISADWDTRDKGIQSEFGKASNPKAKARLGNIYAKDKDLWRGSSEALVTRRKTDQINSGAIDSAEAIAVGDYMAKTVQENETRELIAIRSGAQVDLLTEEEFKIAKIEETIGNSRLTDAQKRSHVNRLAVAVGRVASDKRENALFALGASERVSEGPNAGLIDLDAGIAAIEATDAPPLEKQNAIKTLELQWADQKRGRAVKIAENQDTTRDALNKAEFEGDLTTMQRLVEDGIDGVGVLPETEQRSYLQAIKNDLEAIDKGVPIETDWSGSYRKVRELVTPLANREITYAEAMNVFNEEKKNINSTQRGTLIEKLVAAKDAKPEDSPRDPVDQRIHKAIGQFQTIGVLFPTTAEIEALPEDEQRGYAGLSPEAKEIFDKQFAAKRAVQYGDEYDQWLKDQKTKPTAEQKEKWLDDISRRPKAEVSKKWLSRVFEAGKGLPSGLPLNVLNIPEHQRERPGPLIPEPTTQADYDKIPSGSTYKHPDGTTRTKP